MVSPAAMVFLLAVPAPRAGYFLVATRKYPKKRRPSGAKAPALLGRGGGWPTGHPCPAANARLPGAPLSGLIRLGLRCSARRQRGERQHLKPTPNIKTFLRRWVWYFGFWFGCRPLSRTEHRRLVRIRPAWIYHAGRVWDTRVFRSTRTCCRKTPSPTEERRAPHTKARSALVWGATMGQNGFGDFRRNVSPGRECMPRERRDARSGASHSCARRNAHIIFKPSRERYK